MLISQVRRNPAVASLWLKKTHLCRLLGRSQAAANLILAWIVAISPLAGFYAPLLQCLFISFFSPSLGGSVVIRGKLHTIPLRRRLWIGWDKQQSNLMRSCEPTGPPNNYYIESQLYLYMCAVWTACRLFSLPERKAHWESPSLSHISIRPRLRSNPRSAMTRVGHEVSSSTASQPHLFTSSKAFASSHHRLPLPYRVTSSATLNKSHQPQALITRTAVS